MKPRDRSTPFQPGQLLASHTTAANDAAPFDGVGAGDWGDQWVGQGVEQRGASWGEQWVDQKLRALCDADEHPAPTPRMAELLRLLAESLDRDQRG